MTTIKSLYLATKNTKKIKELKEIIGDKFEVHSIADLPVSWEETGDSFEANAAIKARAVRNTTGTAVLADDSGLEVTSLNGAPGVYSSRYAGEDGNDQANNRKLLVELGNLKERAARFVCCLYFIDEQGNEKAFFGTCEGSIGTEPKGNQGFGYDPLFYPGSGSRSLAEYSSEEKNKISHRSVALTKWLEFIDS